MAAYSLSERIGNSDVSSPHRKKTLAFCNIAPASRTSSIFLRRIIGSMFMRVNLKCAHQVRPPPATSAAPGAPAAHSCLSIEGRNRVSGNGC
jgi:hypothetical protein